MNLAILLRISGASLIVLALFHSVLWRTLRWGDEIGRLSSINARVFVVHTFFVTFVLAALGLLSMSRPDLLVVPSDLGRLLLYAITAFWAARLVMQPLVFDRAMTSGWVARPLVRGGATGLWAAYVLIYGAALHGQIVASH